MDELLKLGCSLNQVRELFLAEVDWRLRCSARVLVTFPSEDIGTGKLMVDELEQALGIPVQLVPIEELASVLEQTSSATVVAIRYFIGQAEAITSPKSVRVIPVRGGELLVKTAQLGDAYKLKAIVKSAHLIISDRASFAMVKAAVQSAREDIIRPPQLVCCENFIATDSINFLKRELGLD